MWQNPLERQPCCTSIPRALGAAALGAVAGAACLVGASAWSPAVTFEMDRALPAYASGFHPPERERTGHVRVDLGTRGDHARGPRPTRVVDLFGAVSRRARRRRAPARPRRGGRRRGRRIVARDERVPRRRGGGADLARHPGPDAHADEHRDVRARRRGHENAGRPGRPPVVHACVGRRRAPACRTRRRRRVRGPAWRGIRAHRHHRRQRHRRRRAHGGRPGAHRHARWRPVRTVPHHGGRPRVLDGRGDGGPRRRCSACCEGSRSATRRSSSSPARPGRCISSCWRSSTRRRPSSTRCSTPTGSTR